MNLSKQKTKQYVDTNPIEALRSISSGVMQSAAKDLGQETMKGLWEQFLGTGEYKKSQIKHSGDLSEGQELNLSLLQAESVNKINGTTERIAAIDYHREIVDAGKHEEKKLSFELQTKIQEIVLELKQLINSSQELHAKYKTVTLQQTAEKPGKYHMAFFELMLKIVREARQKVEDSGAWLAALKSKRGTRGYWQMFKKHGTMFGLSNERVVATQTG